MASGYVDEVMYAFEQCFLLEEFHQERIKINKKYGLKEKSLNFIESQYKVLKNKY